MGCPPHDAARDDAGEKGRYDRRVWASAGAVFVLLVTLVVGVSSQGGFYSTTRLHLALGLGLALALTLTAGLDALQTLRRPPVLTGLLLAAWILAVSALHGALDHGLPAAGLAAGIVAVYMIVPCLLQADREMLAASLVWLGGLVALTSWSGVVLHLHRWAWEGQGLWRASGAITYPNATAAILVSLALWSLAQMPLPPGRGQGTATSAAFGPAWIVPALTTVMLTAAAATLSRGGALALLVGGAVLLLLAGTATRRAAVPPMVGATVSFAALVPCLRSGQPPQPLLATIGLVVGTMIGTRADENARARQQRFLTTVTTAVGLKPRDRGTVVPRALWIGAGTAIAAGVVVLTDGFEHSLRQIVDARVLTGPSYRMEAAGAALERITDSPWIGAGPGEGQVTWTTSSGVSRTLIFLHDEYLQVVLELGVLTGFLVLLHLAAGAASAWKAGTPREGSAAPPQLRRSARAGGLAAFAAFAVHSAVDFTWHLPALPLVVATLLAFALPAAEHAHSPGPASGSVPDDIDVRDDIADVSEGSSNNSGKSSITYSTHPPMT
ncbi:MAG: hypothetical protein QG608_130 [Actinomycetota bacterium]|nr:hypothetical protein [Actinomycetota bacterium]